MPHIISYTEEIEEHGFCDQCPDLKTGDKYLHEVEGKQRLRIVKYVELERYVWENVAQWRIVIEEYLEEEYVLDYIPIKVSPCKIARLRVFVAKGMIGVLTCDKDDVCGELYLPARTQTSEVRGVAPFGFYECTALTKVRFAPMLVIVYEYAFAHCSNLKEMEFNDELPISVHSTAIEHCDNLPKFQPLTEFPFPGKYMFFTEPAFRQEEKKLQQMHFISGSTND